MLVGLTFGICIGIKNSTTFTAINLTDKTIVAIFSGGNFFTHFICNILKYLFISFIILFINNFPYIRFLTNFIFAYLCFSLALDIIILICNFGLAGILFCLFYFLFSVFFIFLLIMISIMCRLSCDCNGNSSKFCCYPYRNIFLTILVMSATVLIFSLLCKIFANFIIIIV